MSVTYVGSRPIGAVCLSIALAVPALTPALSDLVTRIGSLQAQIAANASTAASPPNPVALAASLTTAAAAALASIPAIVASIPGPLLAANVTLAADVASLLALKDLVTTALSTLSAAASAGGLHVLAVDSTPATVGSELDALVSGGMPGGGLPTARVRGVLLLTEDPATFSALSTVLLTG